MLVVHPRIYLSADGAYTNALLIHDGIVVAVGDDAKNQRTTEPVVQPIGACLFPALAEAHIHLWGLGIRSGAIDLTGMRAREIYAALYHDAQLTSGWLLGRQFNDNLWPPDQTLCIKELDKLFPTTPVCLRRIDGHAIWVNSEALRRAGLTRNYVPGNGGHAQRDANGELTGKLIDNAMNPVLDIIPPATEAEDEQTYRDSAALLLQHGITSAHKAWMPWDRLEMLLSLRDNKTLPIRTSLMLDGDHPDLNELILQYPPLRDTEAWLSAQTIKFFADGALGSQGAHVLYPYQDGSTGLQLQSPQWLKRTVKSLMEAQWQVAIHAIGDAAARTVLDAYAQLPHEILRALRPRLEHAQVMQSEDIVRMGELHTIASIQPIHLRSDTVWAHQLMQEEQLERLFPWRELATYTILAAGSDYPIDDPNPWHGIATALSRQSALKDIFFAENALTHREILTAYTSGAAYATHWEHKLGQLWPGFAADMIALDRDPFVCNAGEIWDTLVLSTWLAGELKYDSQAL